MAVSNNAKLRAVVITCGFIFLSLGGVASALGQSPPSVPRPATEHQPKQSADLTPWDLLPSETFPLFQHNSVQLNSPHGETLSSPNGEYVIENVDGPRPRPGALWIGDWHSLYLVNTRLHKKQLLYRYGRWVNVQWSPSSDAVVINDFWAADDSRSILFMLKPKFQRIDLDKLLLAWLKAGPAKDLINGYPVFKFTNKWVGPDSLLLEAVGYGGLSTHGFTKPFRLLYLYRVGHSFVPYSTKVW